MKIIRVWNGDGVTGDGGDGEVTGDKIFTGYVTGDKNVTGEAFSPVKLVLKRDRRAIFWWRAFEEIQKIQYRAVIPWSISSFFKRAAHTVNAHRS